MRVCLYMYQGSLKSTINMNRWNNRNHPINLFQNKSKCVFIHFDMKMYSSV